MSTNMAIALDLPKDSVCLNYLDLFDFCHFISVPIQPILYFFNPLIRRIPANQTLEPTFNYKKAGEYCLLFWRRIQDSKLTGRKLLNVLYALHIIHFKI